MRKIVIPAGKRVSSAMDGELKYVHVAWIPAIPAGMTGLNKLVYKHERYAWVVLFLPTLDLTDRVVYRRRPALQN